MKHFFKFDSIEEDIKRVRIDADCIDTYCEYDGEIEEGETVKCLIIKTQTGGTFYVDLTLEELDSMYEKYNMQTRMGYSGDYE